mgnify:FL=1
MKITTKMPHSFAPMIPGVDRKSDTGSSRTGGIGGGIGTGMLSILMVLIILLLSAFAVLSYSEARAENRLTEKTIQSAQDYYAADRRAEEILFTFHGYWAEGGAEKAKAKIAAFPEEEGESISLSEEEGSVLISCLIPIDQARQLRLELVLGEEGLRTKTRKVESTAQWEDEGIYIWDGG